MGLMQRGFIKEGLLKLYQNRGIGQEVAVLGEGTVMTIEIGTTGGEVAVGVGIGMSVTDTAMVGTDTAINEAGALVPVLITTGAGEEDAMMMMMMIMMIMIGGGGVGVGVGVQFEAVLLIVHPLLGVALHLKGAFLR